MNAKLWTLLPLSLVLAAALPSPASAQIYKCETDAGTPLYQNSPDGTNCVQLDMAPLTTLPAHKVTVLEGKRAGSSGAAKGAGGNGSTGAGQKSAAVRSATPADFPRVDPGTQRARDATRRSILEAELRKEQDRLAALRGEYRSGKPERLAREVSIEQYNERVEQLRSDIERSESSAAAIQRELEGLKD